MLQKLLPPYNLTVNEQARQEGISEAAFIIGVNLIAHFMATHIKIQLTKDGTQLNNDEEKQQACDLSQDRCAGL